MLAARIAASAAASGQFAPTCSAAWIMRHRPAGFAQPRNTQAHPAITKAHPPSKIACQTISWTPSLLDALYANSAPPQYAGFQPRREPAEEDCCGDGAGELGGDEPGGVGGADSGECVA